MILLHVCILLALALLTWAVSMYAMWKLEKGHTFSEVTIDPFLLFSGKIERFFRKEWYRSVFYTNRMARTAKKKIADLFLAMVPAAKQAFTKRDELTGLNHGPSSYYLKSISEKETLAHKTKPKKMF